MILAPKNSNAHLASTWAAGMAIAVLGVGLYGASQPLLPQQELSVMQFDLGDSVFIEEFNPPAAPAALQEEQVEPEPELETPEEIEIPPLPIIEKPLSPPEMAELTPAEPVQETPPPLKPKPTKPAPATKPRPVAQRPSTKTSPDGQAGGSGNSGPPTLFTGGGRSGRFPSPSYPSAARSSGLQGVVRLLVVVETSGIPGSVSIQSSSGHTSLDNAATDHVRRRWRWPSGDVRRYIVPIRFVLQ